MLRPATPLTILLFISFVLLLLSVLSTPVITGIPIASFQGVDFGVFGYCQPAPKGCTSIRIGYTTDGVFSTADDEDFNLPSSARHSLSSLLIVHPVAAFMNLVALALAAAAHFHSPSHSPRYLLGLLILLFPTLLVTLLAFLVDILLFVPHLKWGGWIVLGSTISITASGVVTCAMRRTLVSRKARKKRIAENAEMSGENFYTRQAQEAKLPAAATFSTVESKAPLVNGAPGADNLPSFTTFQPRRSEDRAAPGLPNSIRPDTTPDGLMNNGPYGGAPRSRSNSRPRYDGPRDQYGDFMPERAGAPPVMPLGRGPSGGRGRGPYNMPPPRGGYGPRGRGGPPPPRGGYPMRGGYGPRGPPPAGYNGRGGYPGRGRGGYPPPPGPGMAMMAGAMAPRGMGPPPPGYGPQPREPSPERAIPPEQYNPLSPSVYSVAHPGDSYVPYGARSQSPGQGRQSPYGSRAQSPGGGARQPSPPPAVPPLPGPSVAEMDAGIPIAQSPPASEYMPVRAGWSNASHGNALPLRQNSRDRLAELPSGGSQGGSLSSRRRNRVNSRGSDVYYEDVDPRFASEPEPMPMHGSLVPPPLQPNPATQASYHDEGPDSLNIQPPPLTNSYEDLPGARSPSESETSNFTSVSQRGVNPNWRPGYGGEFNNLPPGRRPPSMRQNVLLDNNPDFQLPGMGPVRRVPARLSNGRGGRPSQPVPSSNVMGMSMDNPYARGTGPVPEDVRPI